LQNPTISLVIPAFNSAGTLQRALDSALAQTVPAYEVIVVDDGSTDELSKLKTMFGNRVTWVRQNNQGAAGARNKGVSLAKGSHVAFLDADDYWEANKLELQTAVLLKHPNVGLCCSVCFEERPGGKRFRSFRRIGQSPGLDHILNPKGRTVFDTACCVKTSSVVVERSVLGLDPFRRGFEPAEDRDLWVRLVTKVPIYFMGQATTTLVLEMGSLSRTNIDRDCGNMLRVVDQSRHLLGPRALRWWRARVYRRWAAEYLGSGNGKAAIRPAAHRLRLQPWSPQAWWILAKALRR
jgi:glycosyltransferase involved in cell wall biosynthesis